MRTFAYYSIYSPDEMLGKFTANSFSEAISIAAGLKRLSIDDFLKLFIVQEI